MLQLRLGRERNLQIIRRMSVQNDQFVTHGSLYYKERSFNAGFVPSRLSIFVQDHVSGGNHEMRQIWGARAFEQANVGLAADFFWNSAHFASILLISYSQ